MSELCKAQEQAQTKLEKAPLGPTTSMLKLSLALADSVRGILLRHTQSEERVRELDHGITQTLKDQGDKLGDHDMILKWQHEALSSLTMLVNVLEGSALGVRRLVSLIAFTNWTPLVPEGSWQSGNSHAPWRCSISPRFRLYGSLSGDLSTS